MSTLMQRTISRAVRGTKPQTNARLQSLASVRWVLATDDGRFVAVDERAHARLVRDPSEAMVYDGRDNEVLKTRFFVALFKVSLMVVLLEP